MHDNTMDITPVSSFPEINPTKAKILNCVEVFFGQICGDSETLRTVMLNTLLVLATESDWTLSTILDVEYIIPLEQFCKKTNPSAVPISLPKLLIMIGKTLEVELDRICGSSIPSFFLKWMISISSQNILTELGDCVLLWTSTPRSSSTFLTNHKTEFLAFLDHCTNKESSSQHLKILTQLCFSAHLEVSRMALQALSKRCKSDSETRTFLQTHSVPFASTDSSSELVSFAGRLLGRLTEHVSDMESLFAESSPSDGTIPALSTTLPSESPLLTGNTILEVLCEGVSLLYSLYSKTDDAFDDILIDSDFVPLLKSTIIACLDLLDHERSGSNCPPSDRTGLLIKILDSSWNCNVDGLTSSHKSLHPIVESAFFDVPQLCSLLERTCRHSSPSHSCHLGMIINVGASLPHLIPRILKENLVERVINTSKPMEVPTTHGQFHHYLIWALANLIRIPKDITEGKGEQKRIRMLQFERLLKPAKQYLQFILQREEFITNVGSDDQALPTRIATLLAKTFLLERELFEDSEIVETGREEWEVGWLVEKTNEKDLGEKLTKIREDDEKMKKDEGSRWKKRVERLREAGHEDAMEGWLIRRDNETRPKIVDYLKSVSEESGMNVRF
ncbi:hypothetical protein BLNAU_9810 [Blattamonas nauphoetae]|uniref:Uncharacterized protein n=1 Tax=Blattamonas nauphoetae TaxID=2049346 RepID=A0ABQ9XUV0_9EUKA|nr:hypothetical protein BLNAU_9810 [Blattamonas nauphoetae]